MTSREEVKHLFLKAWYEESKRRDWGYCSRKATSLARKCPTQNNVLQLEVPVHLRPINSAPCVLYIRIALLSSYLMHLLSVFNFLLQKDRTVIVRVEFSALVTSGSALVDQHARPTRSS